MIFFVRSHFTLSEDPDEKEHYVDSDPKSLSTYKIPDSVTNLLKSGLDDSSVTLSWTPGSLNGTIFYKHRIFDRDVLMKETVDNSIKLTGLTKGRNYVLTVQTIATRAELLLSLESEMSESITTRPYSKPSTPLLFTAEVLDRSLKLTWVGHIDTGGYDLDRYDIRYMQSGTRNPWITLIDVTPGLIIENLMNGHSYVFQLKSVTKNTELGIELSSLLSTIESTSKSITTVPKNVSVVEQDKALNVTWDEPETDNGSIITSYKLYLLNQTSQMTQVITLDPGLREKNIVVTNGIKYMVSLSAMNAIGSSPKSPDIESIPFGFQTVTNILVSGQTVSFSVNLNGKKVDDVSVLAIDNSPDINENLFQTSENFDDIVIGSQNFSKTFNFNNSILKYLIIVRSSSGQIIKTNFNI